MEDDAKDELPFGMTLGKKPKVPESSGAKKPKIIKKDDDDELDDLESLPGSVSGKSAQSGSDDIGPDSGTDDDEPDEAEPAVPQPEPWNCMGLETLHKAKSSRAVCLICKVRIAKDAWRFDYRTKVSE